MIFSSAAIRETAAPDVIGQTPWVIIIASSDGIGTNQVSNFDTRRQEALKRRIDIGILNEGAAPGGGGARGLLGAEGSPRTG